MKYTAAFIVSVALLAHISLGAGENRKDATHQGSNRVYNQLSGFEALDFLMGSTSNIESRPIDKAAAEAQAAMLSELHALDTADAREEESFDRAFMSPEAIDKACKYRSSIGTPPPPMRIALTFDDGPNGRETPWLLDVLKKYNVHATFFMMGSAAKANPDVVKRIAEEGHLIVANHSWSHPNFHTLSIAQQFSQIERTFSLLDDYQPQKFFRYPFGNSTCASNDLLKNNGYKVVGWHVDSCDWAYDNASLTVSEKNGNICGVAPKNRGNFVNHVVESLRKKKGGILLMHEVHGRTIRQIDQILDQLIKDGFTFGNIDEKGFAPSLR